MAVANKKEKFVPETVVDIRVNNTSNRVIRVGHVAFWPGVNILDDQKFKNINSCQGYIDIVDANINLEAKIIDYIEKSPISELEEINPFKAYLQKNVKEIQRDIKDMFDIEQLNGLLEEEQNGGDRSGVTDAIKKQIEDIGSPAVDPDEDQ